MQSSLILIAYAPVLAREDSRPLAVVHGVEQALSGLRLEWTVSDDHQLVPLPERDAWLAQAVKNGGFPLVCNNDERYPVMISGSELSARSGPGCQPQFEVHADLPWNAAGIAAAADVLEAVGDGAHAVWGHVSPRDYGGEVARQTRHSASDPDVSPRGLPAIKLPWEIPTPEIPQYLGWVNYWSTAAAQAIGFPNLARDADLLSRSQRTRTGAWIVRLTEAPLDLDNPAHFDALLRAYERFPEIGGRVTPR